jgi:hypothetical protein
MYNIIKVLSATISIQRQHSLFLDMKSKTDMTVIGEDRRANFMSLQNM